ncbi:MAG: ComEC family competence protein [Alphaproteobacteria bacterium]|nr:ComEC family competence protein [Alphaproteobacteria bacterium]
MWNGLKIASNQSINLFERVGSRLAANFAAERGRWGLWLPVFVGSGVGIYFALPAEPPWWAGGLALAGAALLLFAVRAAAIDAATDNGGAARAAAVALVAALLGFTAAQVRAFVVAAPVLEEKTGPVSVAGRILLVETLPAGEGLRITLDKPRISRVAPDRTPETVRLRVKRPPAEMLVPGDWVSTRAILSPPAGPSVPGGFDFQRHAYFRSLGAIGFAIGEVRLEARATETATGAGHFWLWLERLRQGLTLRIQSVLPGDTGAVAAALMTGDRSAISKTIDDAMRDSGLSHLLSISGLHVSLVAGILFVGLRGMMALVPALALNHPIKKWTAALAIPGTLAYGLLSGLAAPTQRAVIMVALVMLAVLADRRAMSLRTLAWAAVAILLVQPESLFNPGFQMSFASVAALLAFFEGYRPDRTDAQSAWWRTGAVGMLAAVALASLVATAATAPFVVYHFNRFSAYGLAANMIAIPLTSFWVMPWAVLAFALMPFGLEALALVPMGWGVDAVNGIALRVAAWPGAATMMPSLPMAGLVLAAAGGLWLAIWRRPWRYAGAALAVVGMTGALFTRPPDILVDGEGRLLAVRTAEGGLAVSSPRAARFARESWLRISGLEEGGFSNWPKTGAADDAGRFRCDDAGCIIRAHGRSVALVRESSALAEDCVFADVVLSLVPAKRACARAGTAAVVVDRGDLRRMGAHAVWIGARGIEIKTANEARGERPWVPKPKARPGRPEPETPETPEAPEIDGGEGDD